MRERLYDVFSCFKWSLKLYAGITIIGAIIGVIVGLFGNGIQLITILKSVFTVGMWFSCLGLLLSGIGFLKNQSLRELDNEKKWRVHFYKFKLVHVMFFVCFFILVYTLALEAFIFYHIR